MLIAKIIANIQNYFIQSHIEGSNEEIERSKTTKTFLAFLVIITFLAITFFLYKLSSEIEKNKTLADKNSFYANVVNSTEEAVVMSDLNRQVIFWNYAAEKLFKRKKQDVLGIKFERAIGSLKSQEEIDKLCNQVFEKGAFNSSSTIKSGDGNITEIYLSLNLVKDINGNKIGFAATIIDYAILKRNFQLKNQLEILSENSFDPIISVDQNFKITSWNNAAVKAYGFSKEEVINQPVEIFYVQTLTTK